MRYLEIVLAGLIFVTAFVIGTSLPQVDLFGPADSGDLEAALSTPSLLPPTVLGTTTSLVARPAPETNAASTPQIATAKTTSRPLAFEPEALALQLTNLNSTLPSDRKFVTQ
jgi:hypothetical protein